MGNACRSISVNCSNRTALIVDWEGKLRSVEIPATAADLMLEYPGHLVSLAEDVQRTRRFAGVKAEEELRSGWVYLLVPVDRIGSRATIQQMEAVEAIERCRQKKKIGKGRRSDRRVFPAVASEDEKCMAGKGKCGGGGVVGAVEFLEVTMMAGIPGCRLGSSRCNQWKPVLYAIEESF